jgi:pimeloyl-ACP methyl ester carboxylesterase
VPYLSVRGEELYYQERGAGNVAVFVHGFALDHTLWLAQLSALAPKRRCVAMDLRGFGRSGMGIDLERFALHHVDDVIDVATSLGDGKPVDIVGLSLGGFVARTVAARRPDLTRSLTLMGVMGREEYTFPARRSSDLLRLSKDQLARQYATGMLSPDPTVEQMAHTVAMASEVNWSILYAPSAPRAETESEVLLPGQYPVLFMTGADDRITPPEAVARLAAQYSGATVKIVPGAGHLVPVEQPEAVNAALSELWDRSEV